MTRTLFIFIQLFVLIMNILNSNATETKYEIQIQLLTPTEEKLKNEIQLMLPKQINDFLIYPNPATFKYTILPLLSSTNIIRIYDHFKIFYPQLDLGKWLENFDSNIVFDYLKESKVLYQFSTMKPILYSKINKIATIVDNFDTNISLNEYNCALLPSGKIVPFQPSIFLGSDQTFMVAENSDKQEFFVTDEWFRTIAYGKVSENEFENIRDYICEAQNLKGVKKCCYKMRYYGTIPFLKYLKFISPCLDFFNIFVHTMNVCLGQICLCNFLVLVICFGPQLLLILVGVYIVWGIAYHTVMIPFHILTLLATRFLFKLTFLSFCGFTFSLFLGYSYFFPKIIDDFLIHGMSMLVTFDPEKSLKYFPLTSFEIMPKHNMMLLPFLIPRKKHYQYLFKILIFEFLFSLMFMGFIKSWV